MGYFIGGTILGSICGLAYIVVDESIRYEL